MMKKYISVGVALAVMAGVIPAAFALTSSQSSSAGQMYTSPYGNFYANPDTNTNMLPGSSSSVMSSYYPYYQYSSSSYSSLPVYNTYGGSSSSYSLPPAGYGGMNAFQGLSCIGMSGQNFINCLQQYGVMSQPGSVLFNGSGSTMGMFNCNQYTGTQQQQCQQQLISWWKSYNASLQIWLTQLQTYLQSLMASAGISPAQVGSMMGSNASSYGYTGSSSSYPTITNAQAWQLCKQFDIAQQEHCMHDALTDYPRFQDWVTASQLMQSNQQGNANQRATVRSKSNITNNLNTSTHSNGTSTNMNVNNQMNSTYNSGSNNGSSIYMNTSGSNGYGNSSY